MNRLLTGPPGVGKTTVIRRTADRLGDADIPVAGVIAPERRRDGARIGFDVASLAGEVCRPMARLGSDRPHQVGRYGIDVDAIDAVATTVLPPARREGMAVLIDEVGPMQAASDRFVREVHQTLAHPVPTVVTVASAHLDSYRGRIGIDETVPVLEVTTENRDALPAHLASAIEAARSG